mgnify:CR=1 FL=1
MILEGSEVWGSGNDAVLAKGIVPNTILITSQPRSYGYLLRGIIGHIRLSLEDAIQNRNPYHGR